MLCDSLHVSPRLLNGHARFQPANPMKSQPRGPLVEQRVCPLADGHIDFAWAEAPDVQFETGRNHADARVAPPVERDSLSHGVRSRAKLAIPKFRADEHVWARADF